MSCNVLITADRLVKAVLFLVAYTFQARQFKNLSVVFDKYKLFEVAKCPTTNYFTANGKRFPFNFAPNSQDCGPFYPEPSNRESL